MRFNLALSLGALLLGATSLSAAVKTCRPISSFEQGFELRQSQMAAAYNAPARIDVRGSWDLYAFGSYIFWQPTEDNLELGIANASPSNALPIVGNAVNMNFKFKSGFKAGLAIFSDLDNWDGLAQFTWLVGRHSTRSNGPAFGGLLPFWGHPANTPSEILSGKGRWRLRLKLLDLNFGRSCYIGTNLTFRPFFGARGAWIDQKYIATYVPTAPDLTYQMHDTTDSWGIGPETGLDMSWLLGYGFRLIGQMEADLLFTRYNLRIKEQSSTIPGELAVNLRQHHLYCLRPHLDLEMGFGWGSYFCNHNYHIDLSATYGFQVFWSQNMFRNFVSASNVAKSFAPNGDLYIQGATGNLRFDF